MIQDLAYWALINTQCSWALNLAWCVTVEHEWYSTLGYGPNDSLFPSQRENCTRVERRQWRVATSWLRVCLLWPYQPLQRTSLIHLFCPLVFVNKAASLQAGRSGTRKHILENDLQNVLKCWLSRLRQWSYDFFKQLTLAPNWRIRQQKWLCAALMSATCFVCRSQICTALWMLNSSNKHRPFMYKVLVRPEKTGSMSLYRLHVGHSSNGASDIMKYLWIK